MFLFIKQQKKYKLHFATKSEFNKRGSYFTKIGYLKIYLSLISLQIEEFADDSLYIKN